MITITQLTNPTVEALRDVNALMAAMSLGVTPPAPVSPEYFREMLARPDFYFLAATPESGQPVIGILSVYFVQIPSGLICWAEDLIVDERYHKWGVGRLLMERGIEIAKARKARHISLRTNPKRTDANKLYQALGFQQMETNFYRINLSK